MISFVIPVYRSADNLFELYRRITIQFKDDPRGFEIIFIEDCGGDKSWEIIQQLVQQNTSIRGFRLSRNYGQHNALLCGIQAARGDYIVTLDDDLQHPPEEIPKLLAKLAEGYDVVYGPPLREQHGFLRNLASRLIKLSLKSGMGASNAQQVSALRVFRTRLRNAFSEYKNPNVNIDVMLTWATTNYSAIRVRHESRKLGKSGYTTWKLFQHALDMVTGFSVIPLKIASIIGFSFSIFGLIILVYVLITWFFQGVKVPGFVFLASIVSIFSGVQLLTMGIIGEYIGRMHMRLMERPPYLVRDEAKSDDLKSC